MNDERTKCSEWILLIVGAAFAVNIIGIVRRVITGEGIVAATICLCAPCESLRLAVLD